MNRTLRMGKSFGSFILSVHKLLIPCIEELLNQLICFFKKDVESGQAKQQLSDLIDQHGDQKGCKHRTKNKQGELCNDVSACQLLKIRHEVGSDQGVVLYQIDRKRRRRKEADRFEKAWRKIDPCKQAQKGKCH